MSKQTNRRIDRLRVAAFSGAALYVFLILLFKLGFRGKFSKWDGSTTWAEVGSVAPSFLVASIAVAAITYFWPRE
ncbi:hypothetical protein GCM10011521_16260 [Arenimonas soli]|uniref:Uncharacterized protein n=1 Tax=Arenimonas soli TaxID=2269504 RepID=A0ABQ1HJ39_9GAMM|nr:hypothetical protein GCM10011521_16260 [Arenimonas soli]